MRRGVAPSAAPSAGGGVAGRGSGVQYRVTVATAESSSLPSGAGAPRAFESARGENGATLGPWQLTRAAGGAAPPRGGADIFTLAAPARAGRLTHAALWLDVSPGGGDKKPSWLPGLGGGGGAWHVRWLAIEELPAVGAGGAGASRRARAAAASDDDGDSESGSGSDDDDDAAAAPTGRLYFFPLDKARRCVAALSR